MDGLVIKRNPEKSVIARWLHIEFYVRFAHGDKKFSSVVHIFEIPMEVCITYQGMTFSHTCIQTFLIE